MYLAAIVGEFVSAYGQQYLTMLVAQRSLADLRVADVRATCSACRCASSTATPVGRLVSRVTTDVDVLQRDVRRRRHDDRARRAEAASASSAFMLWIDWRLALVSLVLLPVMVGAIDFFRRTARRTYREIRERIARINGYLQEAISGMSVIAALGPRGARRYAEFERLNDDAPRRQPPLEQARGGALLGGRGGEHACRSPLMLLRGRPAARAAALVELGTIVAFIQYIQQFFVPIRDFSAKYAVMQSSMTAAERIFALLDTPPEPVPGARRACRRSCAARSTSTTSGSPTAARTGCCATSRSASRRASRSRSSAPPARARRRSSSCSTASTTCSAAASWSTASTCASGTRSALRRRIARGAAGRLPVQRHASPPTSRSAAPDIDARGASRRRRAHVNADRFIAAPAAATTRRSASAAATSRPASASCSPSRARSPTTRRSWCSTRRPRASTPRPSG